MAGDKEGELSEEEIIGRAYQVAIRTGDSVKFSLGETKLVIDKDLHVGLEDPKKALSSPSVQEKLTKAANFVDGLGKTIPGSTQK